MTLIVALLVVNLLARLIIGYWLNLIGMDLVIEQVDVISREACEQIRFAIVF